jgi:hypothetical protein
MMTIRQQGGVFGRNPKFNDVEATDVTVDNNASVGGELTVTGDAGFGTNNPTKPVHVYSSSNLDHILVDGPVVSRNIGWATNGSARWNFYTTSDAESGSNAGSNLRLATYTDAGGYNGRVMDFYRDTKDVMITSGNLIIGTSGKGIDFSATSGTGTSELFDDYEEGNYTGTLTPTTSGSITVNVAAPRINYTKIGRVVFISGFLEVGSVSSPVGSDVLLNLPFTVSSLPSDSSRMSSGIYVDNTLVPVRVFNGGTTARIGRDASLITTGDQFYISFNYIAA